MEALGGTFHAIHIPTLDLSPEQLAKIPINYVDGKTGRYDQTPAHTHAI